MEKKYICGRVYGSKISSNGKWLNLLIVTGEKGKESYIVVPFRLEAIKVEGKPLAEIANGEAIISGIPVYPTAEAPKKPEKAYTEDDLPF